MSDGRRAEAQHTTAVAAAVFNGFANSSTVSPVNHHWLRAGSGEGSRIRSSWLATAAIEGAAGPHLGFLKTFSDKTGIRPPNSAELEKPVLP